VIGRTPRNSERIPVKLSWGKGRDMELVWLADGESFMYRSDGDWRYPLLTVTRHKGTIVIRPKCLMIAGEPNSLRRAADSIEENP